MYQIYFYKDKYGKGPVLDYLKKLRSKNNKDSRINANKISDYIQILSNHGTRTGEPFIKHLDGEIWELRPLKNRIFFVACHEDSYILPHHFMKKTQKTPKRKIEKAKRELAEIKERSLKDE